MKLSGVPAKQFPASAVLLLMNVWHLISLQWYNVLTKFREN